MTSSPATMRTDHSPSPSSPNADQNNSPYPPHQSSQSRDSHASIEHPTSPSPISPELISPNHPHSTPPNPPNSSSPPQPHSSPSRNPLTLVSETMKDSTIGSIGQWMSSRGKGGGTEAREATGSSPVGEVVSGMKGVSEVGSAYLSSAVNFFGKTIKHVAEEILVDEGSEMSDGEEVSGGREISEVGEAKPREEVDDWLAIGVLGDVSEVKLVSESAEVSKVRSYGSGEIINGPDLLHSNKGSEETQDKLRDTYLTQHSLPHLTELSPSDIDSPGDGWGSLDLIDDAEVNDYRFNVTPPSSLLNLNLHHNNVAQDAHPNQSDHLTHQIHVPYNKDADGSPHSPHSPPYSPSSVEYPPDLTAPNQSSETDAGHNPHIMEFSPDSSSPLSPPPPQSNSIDVTHSPPSLGITQSPIAEASPPPQKPSRESLPAHSPHSLNSPHHSPYGSAETLPPKLAATATSPPPSLNHLTAELHSHRSPTHSHELHNQMVEMHTERDELQKQIYELTEAGDQARQLFAEADSKAAALEASVARVRREGEAEVEASLKTSKVSVWGHTQGSVR
eukprot:GHVN01012717.1.p1 GENE.GHVN01012717.1~~GHVN01012717.1.p1  ORF type:complete len:561 (+),score=219.19 GHVN01012717.1:167-1849(+)